MRIREIPVRYIFLTREDTDHLTSTDSPFIVLFNFIVLLYNFITLSNDKN